MRTFLLQVWKDVDGVLTCDPNIYPDAEPVPYLTFDEAAELAYFGAQVSFYGPEPYSGLSQTIIACIQCSCMGAGCNLQSQTTFCLVLDLCLASTMLVRVAGFVADSYQGLFKYEFSLII